MGFMRFLVSALVAGATVFGGLQAAATGPAPEALARTAPLMAALGIPELLQIVHEEGVGNAETLEGDMFPGRGRDRWKGIVADIYDVDRMDRVLLEEMAAGLDAEALEPLLAFFRSELGQRIIALEVSARRAMLDASVEAAAQDYLALLLDEESDRFDLLDEFATLNNLIETNISAALNANYAFYSGLNDAGAFGETRSEGDIVSDVWRQEEGIRLETEMWVMSYLALAYQPLSDEELRAYVDFSRTEASQKMNAQLFVSFDVLFRTISREMGLAAAQFMGGEDI